MEIIGIAPVSIPKSKRPVPIFAISKILLILL
jgi:hypothetical protein